MGNPGRKGRRRILALAPAFWVVLSMAAMALSSTRSLDLRTVADLKLLQTHSVATAGDVNGDRIPDLIASHCQSENEDIAVSHVYFGPLRSGRYRLGEVPVPGFRIDGGPSEDGACRVAAAGDVNGDGFDDVLVGASLADNSGGTDSGTVYVVFGNGRPEPVSLVDFDENRQGSQGFRIDGSGSLSLVGSYIAPGGDISGDGLDDVVVGSFGGSTYVVFGKETTEPVDLLDFEQNTQGMAGYRIDTPSPDVNDGYAVGGAGDVNADGTPDVIVGVIPRFRRSAGSAYVVFGKPDPLPVDVEAPGVGSIRIKGVRVGDRTGHSVAAAGDVNGDGTGDMIVGSPGRRNGAGSAWIVFGKNNPEDVFLKSLGGGGYEIRGKATFDGAGRSVAPYGDVNGDGKSDILIGANATDVRGRVSAGSVYVIYGRKKTVTVKLEDLGHGGYRFYGERAESGAGWTVASAGDLDGDGREDILSTASGDGRGYAIWGVEPR